MELISCMSAKKSAINILLKGVMDSHVVLKHFSEPIFTIKIGLEHASFIEMISCMSAKKFHRHPRKAGHGQIYGSKVFSRISFH